MLGIRKHEEHEKKRQDQLIEMIMDAVESHQTEHGLLPEIVWVSPDLHRQVVLSINPIVKGQTVICRAHSLSGLSCCTVLYPEMAT